MKNQKKYIKRSGKTVVTNRGREMHFVSYYAKETPEGFWESVYGALEHIGVFDGIL